MKELDIRYLCTTIGNLSGVPVRIFENDQPVFYYSLSKLPRDPMTAYREEIFSVHAHVELSREDVEELARHSPLPVECCCQGRPLLLATRAETEFMRSIRDSLGQTFLVRKNEDGLTLLYPEVSFSVEPPLPLDRIADLRVPGPAKESSRFNWERGLD